MNCLLLIAGLSLVVFSVESRLKYHGKFSQYPWKYGRYSSYGSSYGSGGLHDYDGVSGSGFSSSGSGGFRSIASSSSRFGDGQLGTDGFRSTFGGLHTGGYDDGFSGPDYFRSSSGLSGYGGFGNSLGFSSGGFGFGGDDVSSLGGRSALRPYFPSSGSYSGLGYNKYSSFDDGDFSSGFSASAVSSGAGLSDSLNLGSGGSFGSSFGSVSSGFPYSGRHYGGKSSHHIHYPHFRGSAGFGNDNVGPLSSLSDFSDDVSSLPVSPAGSSSFHSVSRYDRYPKGFPKYDRPTLYGGPRSLGSGALSGDFDDFPGPGDVSSLPVSSSGSFHSVSSYDRYPKGYSKYDRPTLYGGPRFVGSGALSGDFDDFPGPFSSASSSFSSVSSPASLSLAGSSFGKLDHTYSSSSSPPYSLASSASSGVLGGGFDDGFGRAGFAGGSERVSGGYFRRGHGHGLGGHGLLGGSGLLSAGLSGGGFDDSFTGAGSVSSFGRGGSGFSSSSSRLYPGGYPKTLPGTYPKSYPKHVPYI